MANAQQAKNGDTVKVHYTGRLSDGTVFDSSEGGEPLEFTIGDGSIIKGFEETIIGMAEGESRTRELDPADAYGPRDDDMVIHVDRGQMPKDLNPEVGQMLQIRQPDGQVVPVRVADVTDNEVTLDANHPLAGKALIFDIKLVTIGHA